jgi:hypothetical protein
VAFHELNASKVSESRFLLFKRDQKAIAGMIVVKKEMFGSLHFLLLLLDLVFLSRFHLPLLILWSIAF